MARKAAETDGTQGGHAAGLSAHRLRELRAHGPRLAEAWERACGSASRSLKLSEGELKSWLDAYADLLDDHSRLAAAAGSPAAEADLAAKPTPE